MRNRVFFPQAALDEWVAGDRIDLKHDELTLKSEGRRYRIIEAMRVVREVTGAADAYELLGKVKSRAFLAELGAEILENSMILGDNAYDVVTGFVGAPVGNLAELTIREGKKRPSTDEELLTGFLSAEA
jgi:hypothetical protein